MKRFFSTCSVFILIVIAASCSKDVGNYDFENGYSSGVFPDTIGDLSFNTDPSRIDYSKYSEARLFPGLISDEEPRYDAVVVPIDLDYVNVTSSDLRISVAPGTWQSTALYAPAGELITIEVPPGIYGLTLQIGAHTASGASAKNPTPQRDLLIYTRQTLFPGTNYARNLYGGLIYILPTSPLGRTIDLTFSGVAKAPSFKLGVTNQESDWKQKWKETIQNTSVPWFELEGNRIVFTLQTAKAKEFFNTNDGLQDPEALMQEWDKMIREVYWDWTGLTEGNPDPKHRAPFNKWRIVHDVLFDPGVAQVSGYPVRAGATNNYFNQATTIAAVQGSNWGTYHELGHNMQQNSTWNVSSVTGEVTNNLFSYRAANLNGFVHSGMIRHYNNAKPYLDLSFNSKNWMEMATIENNRFSSTHLDIKLIFYAQIFEYYDGTYSRYISSEYKSGYDFMTYLYTRARNARFVSSTVQARNDFYYEALSEFLQTDMAPFCIAGWGFPISSSARARIKAKDYPVLDKRLWEFNPVTGEGGNDPLGDYNIDIPQSTWTYSTNSEHATYKLERAFDNVVSSSSFWHVGAVKFPNEIIINMSSSAPIVAAGLYFQQRPTYETRYVTKFKVEVRNNSSQAWTQVDFETGNTLIGMNGMTGKYYIKFTGGQKTFSQVRITLQEGNHADVAFSEIGAFQALEF